MQNRESHRHILSALSTHAGIRDVRPLEDRDREKILEIEKDAEKKSLMGLGKVVNTGIREVLNCDLVYVALTDMDFDWGRHPSLILKKGEEIVGEEVRDEVLIENLRRKKNVWFMHRNFVVYKDRVSFPQDIMRKICHFEIPSLPADWGLRGELGEGCEEMIFANPVTPCDIFLKRRYFNGRDEHGFGTILIGMRMGRQAAD